MEIILAEDEVNLRLALRHAFERETWTVRDFADGLAAWEFLSSGPGAQGANSGRRVLVLDIVMPRLDGLELCRRVRALDQTVPLLFLSSRDEEFDRVLGLELGADDYLCKPFSVRELVTRIKVLHRRAYGLNATLGGPAASSAAAGGPAAAGRGLQLDAEAYRAWWGERELHLTVSEFRILASLATTPGTVKTREQLQLAAYPDDAYINERSVDCHIKRLRRKLESAGAGGQAAGSSPLEAVYGLGYRLAT